MAKSKLDNILNEALKIIKSFGTINLSGNELVKIGDRSLPKIFFGPQNITGDFTIIDKITSKLNCPCSFMYIAPEGLIRMSTSLKDSAGNRINGTLIDNSHPITISIKKGVKEIGRSWIINDYYETVDIPIFNETGEAVVAFGLGIREISGEREIILFQIGSNIYGFNIMFINEVIRVPDLIRTTTSDNKYIIGVFSLKEEIVPLIDTNKLFGFKPELGKNSEHRRVLIIQFETKKFGFIVDKVLSLAKFDLNDLEKFQLKEMETLSNEMIHGVLPKIKSYNNVIVLYADKLVEIITRNI
jgi:purine-binding chemotaxis protein CheW